MSTIHAANGGKAKQKVKTNRPGGKSARTDGTALQALIDCNYRGAGLDLDCVYLEFAFSQKSALQGVTSVQLVSTYTSTCSVFGSDLGGKGSDLGLSCTNDLLCERREKEGRSNC